MSSMIQHIKNTNPIFNAEPLAEEIQQAIYKTVSAAQIFQGESLNRRKDGSAFICEYQVAPLLRDGAPYAYISIQRDITERKQIETELLYPKRLKSGLLKNLEHQKHKRVYQTMKSPMLIRFEYNSDFTILTL